MLASTLTKSVPTDVFSESTPSDSSFQSNKMASSSSVTPMSAVSINSQNQPIYSSPKSLRDARIAQMLDRHYPRPTLPRASLP